MHLSVASLGRRISLPVVLLLPLTFSWFIVDPAVAQRPPDQAPVAPGEPPQIANVILDGQVLFKVRGTTAYPAAARADAIVGRLETLASNDALSLDNLRIEEAPDRSILKVADEMLVAVFDVDAQIEGVSRQILAETYRIRIKAAVTKYRQDRDPRVLLLHTVYVLGATGAFSLLVFVVVRGSRRLEQSLDQRYKSKWSGIQVKAFRIVEGERLWDAVHAFLRLLRTMLILVLLFLYSEFVLGLYPWTRPLAQHLWSLLLDPLRTMGLSVVASIPSLIFLVVLAVVIRWLLKILKLYFSGVEHGTIRVRGFDPDWALPTFRILRLLTIAFGLVIAYPHVPGSESEAFKGVSILLGVIFSLGSSSAVANTIAGYSMIYRRAFKVGDRIKVDDIIGDVTQMRLQVTHLRSLKNEEITIPNSTMLNSSIINYSTLARERGLILHTTVGIGYEVPWRQVEAMLLEAANRTPGLLREPPPFVLQRSLGDFAVNYELNVYCDRPQQSLQLYTELHRNILDLFNEHGVQIMTPAYEGDPDSPKVVPREQWFAPPAQASPADRPVDPSTEHQLQEGTRTGHSQ